MLLSLKLRNFQQHTELDLTFAEGLNVIRGANEKGKSSIYRAIAYALGGSRALPESLEETVTWGQPVSTLLVELHFMVGKNTFKIVRKKSGAELTGDGVTASGHAEVTAFVERQLGASAKIAQATLLANQKSLTDGLDSSATPLIEKLAGLDLFDVLVTGIQTKLPSGNTKALEGQVQGELGVSPAVDGSPALQAVAESCETTYGKVRAGREAAEAELAALTPAYQKSLEVHTRWRQKQAEIATTSSTLAALAAKQPPKLVEPDMSQEAALREAVARHEQQQELWRLDALVARLPAVTDRVPAVDYQLAVTQQTAELAQARAKVHEASVQLAGLQASRIVEVSCKICEKELSEIPAVLRFNENLQLKIDAVTVEVESAKTQEADTTARLARLAGLESVDKAIRRHLGRDIQSVHLKVDETTVPLAVSQLFERGESDAEAKRKLDVLLKSKQDYDASVRDAKVRAEGLATLQQKLQGLQAEEQELAAGFDLALLGSYPERERILNERKALEASAHQNWKDAVRAVEQEQRMFAVKSEAYEAAVKKRAELEALLKQYHSNNALLAKLRDTRPQVAAQLWALVLGGVSHYFSAIRGTASLVTRDADGFRIDGKAARVFSGSTQDALGLAQRLVLLKTFLPNTSFMLVDEPGAACDDTRELEMLATLSSCGVRQVLVVTHSDLADAYATNVIQI